MVLINLSESNPYFTGRVYELTAGNYVLRRAPFVYQPSAGDRIETVKSGDTLQKIAWRVYRGTVPDPERWYHIIADANRIANPARIENLVGKTVIIPDLNLARVERL